MNLEDILTIVPFRSTDAFKIQSHLMFYDTAHNSTRTVLTSLQGAFVETASKMWAYLRCLGKNQHPSSEMILS